VSQSVARLFEAYVDFLAPKETPHEVVGPTLECRGGTMEFLQAATTSGFRQGDR